MINILWSILILGGILIACITGNVKELGNVILSSSNESFTIINEIGKNIG